jgi:glycosyltransferase involved in cell wall biosynthesis
VYLPSLGGGNKANRLLLEGLAAQGHECRAVASAFTTRAGPTNAPEFHAEMNARGIGVQVDGGRFRYSHNHVLVDALDGAAVQHLPQVVKSVLDGFQPDWILVSDDKRRVLLEIAVDEAADRTVSILQTVFHLPFGPHAVKQDEEQTRLLASAGGRVAISRYLQAYLRDHGALASTLLALPVYGSGPFKQARNFGRGSVTMINPCIEKGVDIFIGLAKRFPTTPFTAVPTWGADALVLAALGEVPNVTVRAPADDIDGVLADTTVLLAPSVWPETFGYVVPESMVRGVPVIASDSGGLPEAKLGVDYVVPIRPAEWADDCYVSPVQDLSPWATVLHTLLSDHEAYERCSADSRRAALAFIAEARVDRFEAFLEGMS